MCITITLRIHYQHTFIILNDDKINLGVNKQVSLGFQLETITLHHFNDFHHLNNTSTTY